MKVLVVNTVSFGLNGITSVIMNYFRAMDKKDIQMDFVTIDEINDEFRDELLGNGSRVFFIPNRKRNPINYIKKLYHILKNEKYDIIHAHGNSALLTVEMIDSILAKTPVRIAHSHNTTCTYMKLHKLLYRIFQKSYTHGFACGIEAGKWLFGDRDFKVIKNGIDLYKFKYCNKIREEYRKKLGLDENTKILGHVGNFVTQKNHTFLIDVFAEVCKRDNNIVLLLISDGELLETIRNKVINLGLENKVIFLGKTTNVSSYMQAMDMMLLPSLFEGLPVVLVEAQGIGLHCLVSDTVSVEAKLTELISFIPINNGTDIWVENVLNYMNTDNAKTSSREVNGNKSEEYYDQITECGYNIVHNAKMMKDLYAGYCNAAKH